MHNILFVNSAGNTPGPYGRPDVTRRDRYTPDGHLGGYQQQWADYLPGAYEETMATLATDKAILAKWATTDAKGDTVPYIGSVKCGNAKESCFSLMLPPESEFPDEWRGIGTSFAAPRLTAYAFYLSQLWDKAEEVTHALRDAARDIGEPGVDDEFGQGLIDKQALADSKLITEREKTVANGSLALDASSPATDSEGAGANASFSGYALAVPLTGPGTLPFGIVPSVRRSDKYSALSLAAPIAGGKAILAVGRGTSPLGATSSFRTAGEKTPVPGDRDDETDVPSQRH